MEVKINNIEKLKKQILEIQKEKIGEINTENLKKLNYSKSIIDSFEIVENKYKSIKKMKEDYEIELSRIESEYNLNEIDKIINNHEKRKQTIQDNFNKEFKKLELKLIDLETKKNVVVDNSYKIKVDELLNDNIFLEKYLKKLKKKLYNLEEKIKKINNKTKNDKNKIIELYKIKISKYCCGQKGGSIEENILQCKKIKKMRNSDLFLEKYDIYLKELLDLCRKYGELNGITIECIKFTEEHIKEEKKLLEEFIEKNESLNLELNIANIKSDYYGKISNINSKNNKELANINKVNNDKISNINKVIEYYEKLEDSKSEEDYEIIIEDLNVKNKNLKIKKNDLKTVYLEKYNFIINEKVIYLKELNDVKEVYINMLKKVQNCDLCK